MARDLSAQVRGAMIEALNAPTSRTYAMCEGRAYGAAEPGDKTWPFIRADLPIVVPVPESCSDVQEYTFRLHGFTKAPDERATSALGSAMVADLDGLAVALDANPAAFLTETQWTGTTHMRDTVEPDGWHASVTVTCRVDS